MSVFCFNEEANNNIFNISIYKRISYAIILYEFYSIIIDKELKKSSETTS